MIPKRFRTFVTWLVMAATLGATVSFALLRHDEPEPIPFEPSDVQANGGWVSNPAEVEAFKAQLAFPVFADTPAGVADDPLPAQVYMWQAYAKLFGALPPSKDQGQIGSCVAFGTNNAITRTMAADIALQNAQFEFRDIAEEVTYGGSRVQVGGGKLGRGDGSTGAWAAKFVHDWGVVARDKYPGSDLTAYSVNTCRSMGANGVPANLQTVAKNNPVRNTTQVSSWADAKKALASGYGIGVCSNQGFTTQRDANGICQPRGSWNHCMCLDGYTSINGKEYGHIENSWGAKSASGPTGPGAPSSSGFWADSGVVDRMLKQNDSWAFSSVQGFPSRKLDWFVLLIPRPPPEPLARLNLEKIGHAR